MLDSPRTPEYSDTSSSTEWDRPSLDDYTSLDGVDSDRSSVGDLTDDEKATIAARSFLGDPDASSYDDLVVLPVVNGNDALVKGALTSAFRMAGQVDGVGESTAEEVKQKAKNMLDSQFDAGDDVGEVESGMQPQGFDPDGWACAREWHAAAAFEKVESRDDRTVTARTLIPDALDHMGDFVRPQAIESMRDGFMSRYKDGEATGGVQHTVFPREDITLLESYTVSEGQDLELGETVAEPGTWITTWRVESDELWSLVEDGILTGVSIGGTVPPKGTTVFEPGDMPDDVTVPEDVQSALEDAEVTLSDLPTRRIDRADLHEVSLVDYPAVPGATYATAKAAGGLAKGGLDMSDPESMVDHLETRGHSTEAATRLAGYLLSAAERDDPPEPSGGVVARLLRRLRGGRGADDDTPQSEDPVQTDSTEILTRMPEMHDDNAPEWAKTLNATLVEQTESLDEFSHSVAKVTALSRADGEEESADATEESAAENTTDDEQTGDEDSAEADDDDASAAEEGTDADGDESDSESEAESVAASAEIEDRLDRMEDMIATLAEAQGVSQQAAVGQSASAEKSREEHIADALGI